MNNKITQLREKLSKLQKDSNEGVKRFFKTSPGAYSEKDEFLGIPVPELRKIANEYKDLQLVEIQEMLDSSFNEERLLALFILCTLYAKGSSVEKEEVYRFYMRNLKNVNNWNLVDSSAHLILGAHLHQKDKAILFTLSSSSALWDRRIAIVATWYGIRQNDLEATFSIAEILLGDKEDLIHKAVGWMLREAGKKDEKQLILFLEKHFHTMPRTMLRYALERLSPSDKERFMKKPETVKKN